MVKELFTPHADCIHHFHIATRPLDYTSDLSPLDLRREMIRQT